MPLRQHGAHREFRLHMQRRIHRLENDHARIAKFDEVTSSLKRHEDVLIVWAIVRRILYLQRQHANHLELRAPNTHELTYRLVSAEDFLSGIGSEDQHASMLSEVSLFEIAAFRYVELAQLAVRKLHALGGNSDDL